MPPSALATRVAALLAAVLAALLVPATPAEAHPFGPPQTVAVDADERADTVRVRWRVGGTDDLALLGISLGVIPEDRVMLDGAVVFEEADATTLAAAPAFADYLLQHVAVTSAGSTCTGELVSAEELATDGVELAYACAPGLTTAAVEVTTLTDLHPAYRTLATGPDGQRAVYDAEQPTHEWTLAGDAPAGQAGQAADLGTSAALQIGAVLGVLLLSVLAGLVWFRRRGRAA